MAEAPDEELMLAYRGGDTGAFEILYGRHRARLFRFVLRSVKIRATAEDLYQEIWMRVIEARAGYAPTARFTTWLYTIAHNRLGRPLAPARSVDRRARRSRSAGQ
jgi:RNA polymerase sigma factor (sigma-70 family)